jgi:hypothetical protein
MLRKEWKRKLGKKVFRNLRGGYRWKFIDAEVFKKILVDS